MRERSEASGGWRATKIGLQLAGSKFNFNLRDPSRIYNERRVRVIESFPFNSVLHKSRGISKRYAGTE